MRPSELPSVDLLLQFNEESGELIQSIAKTIRKERGLNPSPVSLDECKKALLEELSDVYVVLDVLLEHWGFDMDDAREISSFKKNRWQERLNQ